MKGSTATPAEMDAASPLLAASLRCPMLRSGSRFSTEAEANRAWWSPPPPPPPGIFPKAAEALQLDVMQAVSESRVPLSDLALCAPSPEEMEANGMVPYAP
jgi:hypothetical protein